MRRGPLSNSYPATVGLVVCSLIPFLGLTAAVLPVLSQIGRSLHLSPAALDVTVAMSTAAYAFGTVLAVQLAVHLPARRLLVVYETVFVAVSFLAATTHDGAVFVAAFIVQGLCTSLMLIAAVPPLVTAWPPRKMPVTGAVMNLCIFGAVAIGPTIGNVVGGAQSWRLLFWGVAGVAVLALVLSLLTFEDQPAQDRSSPVDVVAVALAALGSGAAFYGAGQLQASDQVGVGTLVPLLAGAAMIVALVVHQYKVRAPLMPVRAFATTVPVAGITVALFASAAAFGLMELVLLALKTLASPADAAWLFLPEFLAAAVTAALFGALFRTRFTPVLALGGMAALVASAAVFLGAVGRGGPMVAVGAGLLGLGVGAAVSPSLFMAGFSLRSAQLQRVFALIELLRGVTAFLVAPVLVFLVTVLGRSQTHGIEATIWICLGLAAFGGLLAVAVLAAGWRHLHTPDIDRWQEEGEPAWTSPPLGARLRRPPPIRTAGDVGAPERELSRTR